MKISFGIIVFNGNYVLEECIKSVYPYASQILIAEGPVSYWQSMGYKTSFDGTNEIIDNYPDPENKIKIIHSQYSEKGDQAQSYMKFLNQDNDYIWNLDCDEIFKPEDIEKIIFLLETEKYTNVNFKSISFYGGFDRYITGFEENSPFVRIRKIYPGSYWKSHRPPVIGHVIKDILPEKELNFNYLSDKYGIRMYHYSYVFPFQVNEKIKYYNDYVHMGGNISNYFNSLYLPWVNGNDNQKLIIEKKYKGVHEYRPELRGESFTSVFKGEHPKIILENMDKLKYKFNEQLKNFLQ